MDSKTSTKQKSAEFTTSWMNTHADVHACIGTLTCISDEYWFLQWNIGQVSRFVGDSFERSLLGCPVSVLLQLFEVRLDVGLPVCRRTEQLVTLRALKGLGTCQMWRSMSNNIKTLQNLHL